MEGGNIRASSLTSSSALPIEIPEPPDLSRIPSHVLHSGTVETLIGHNEDLTARLMVNIRRNSILEGQVLEQERLNTELSQINNSISSQLEVLQEKDRIWKDKTNLVDNKQEQLQEEVQFLEVKLRASEVANTRLRASARFQRRVRLWVAPFISRLKNELKTEIARRQKADAQINDLRIRLSEVAETAKNLENKFLRDQTRLVEQYEARLTDTHSIREKALRFDELTARKTELENRVIFLERRRTDVEGNLSHEVQTARADVTQYRQEAKMLAAENAELNKELQEKTGLLNELAAEVERQQDQLESMRAVWAESQKRIEAFKTQHDTLNRFNQELSRQLKELKNDSTRMSDSQPPASADL